MPTLLGNWVHIDDAPLAEPLARSLSNAPIIQLMDMHATGFNTSYISLQVTKSAKRMISLYYLVLQTARLVVGRAVPQSHRADSGRCCTSVGVVHAET